MSKIEPLAATFVSMETMVGVLGWLIFFQISEWESIFKNQNLVPDVNSFLVFLERYSEYLGTEPTPSFLPLPDEMPASSFFWLCILSDDQPTWSWNTV